MNKSTKMKLINTLKHFYDYHYLKNMEIFYRRIKFITLMDVLWRRRFNIK